MSTILNDATPLERYGHNLTELAKLGAFSPLSGQDAVVNRLFQVLLRENKCNPVLLGSHKAERWAALIEVIRRMAIGDAPDPLPDKQVIVLDYEALLAGLPEHIFRPRVYCFPTLTLARVLEFAKIKHSSRNQTSKQRNMSEKKKKRVNEVGNKADDQVIEIKRASRKANSSTLNTSHPQANKHNDYRACRCRRRRLMKRCRSSERARSCIKAM